MFRQTSLKPATRRQVFVPEGLAIIALTHLGFFSLTLVEEICYPVPVHIENLDGLTRVLQASISPVALVSGVGLLILSQTNRFSRVADRLRELAHERRENPGQHADLSAPIDVLLKRARILRVSIGA